AHCAHAPARDDRAQRRDEESRGDDGGGSLSRPLWLDIDLPPRPRHRCRMTITLSREAEEYVRELLGAGGFSRPARVVDLLIMKERADVESEKTSPSLAGEQLKAALLKATQSPRREYTDADFDDLAARVVAVKR